MACSACTDGVKVVVKNRCRIAASIFCHRRAYQTCAEPPSAAGSAAGEIAVEKVADQRLGNLELVLGHEMTAVEHIELGVPQISPVGIRPVGWEDLVVFCPR